MSSHESWAYKCYWLLYFIFEVSGDEKGAISKSSIGQQKTL